MPFQTTSILGGVKKHILEGFVVFLELPVQISEKVMVKPANRFLYIENEVELDCLSNARN